MRPRAVIAWCPIVLALTRPAQGMQLPRLDPGTCIRFDAPGLGGRVTGTLLSWESDTLMVNVDGDAPGLALVVPADSVTRIDVERERHLTLEGFGLGVLAGTLVALAASPDEVDDNGNCTTVLCLSYKESPRVGTRLAVLGAVGALLGTIAGSDTKTTTWKTVPLQHLSFGATSDGGLAIGLHVPF